MSMIHLHRTTTSTPEQFLAALIDFGPGRSKLFGNSAGEYLKVHHRGAYDADVSEGSGGIWERLHYDWSDRLVRDEPSTGRERRVYCMDVEVAEVISDFTPTGAGRTTDGSAPLGYRSRPGGATLAAQRKDDRR